MGEPKGISETTGLVVDAAVEGDCALPFFGCGVSVLKTLVLGEGDVVEAVWLLCVMSVFGLMVRPLLAGCDPEGRELFTATLAAGVAGLT